MSSPYCPLLSYSRRCTALSSSDPIHPQTSDLTSLASDLRSPAARDSEKHHPSSPPVITHHNRHHPPTHHLTIEQSRCQETRCNGTRSACHSEDRSVDQFQKVFIGLGTDITHGLHSLGPNLLNKSRQIFSHCMNSPLPDFK